ncbi:hypothetical protein [Nocardiopsis protaetiae]|uniref:hypothetical protein n=3 Tax=Nocardiopsis protaetiae TaxID=3382270 RepID=UPI00387B2107
MTADRTLVDFLERLKHERGLPLWHPRGPRAHPVLALVAVVVLGGLLGVSVHRTAAELVRAAAFEHHARTAEATVVEIRHGDPVVSFTPDDRTTAAGSEFTTEGAAATAAGEEVTVDVHDVHRNGDLREVTERLPVGGSETGEEAAIADGGHRNGDLGGVTERRPVDGTDAAEGEEAAVTAAGQGAATAAEGVVAVADGGEGTAVGAGEEGAATATAPGGAVTAVAYGSYRHGDPREVTVRYLADRRQPVALADHRWTPWWVLPLGAAVVFAVHACWAPTGVRGGWAWRRAKAHVKGPEPGGWSRRDLVRPALGAGALLAAAVALAALPVASGGVPGLAVDPEGLMPLVPATVCVVGAGTVAVRAAYRWAERVPAPHPPRPFRLLGLGWFWVPSLVVFAVAALGVLVLPLLDRPETRVPGTAEIVDVNCKAWGRGPCTTYLVLRYEADGLPYVEEVRGRYVRGGLPVEWDPEDPTAVRIAE